MMRVRILSNCRAAGSGYQMGSIAELPDGSAGQLLALGLAEIAPEPEPAPVCAPKPASRRSTVTATKKED